MKELKHKKDGYILDKTRNKYSKIKNILIVYPDSPRYEEYSGFSVNKNEPVYALTFFDSSTTQFLLLDILEELYPYIGINETCISVLYGQK